MEMGASDFFLLSGAANFDCQPYLLGLLYFLLVKQGVNSESLQGPDRRFVVIVGEVRRRMRASNKIENGS